MKIKKVAACLIGCLLLFQPIFSGFAADSPILAVKKYGDFTFLSFRDAAVSLGYEVNYKSETHSVILVGKDKAVTTLSLNTGAGANEKGSFTVMDQIRNENGVLYISTLGLSRVLGAAVSFKDNKINMTALSQEITDAFTITKLTEMALSRDKALAKAKYEADRTGEIADYQSSNFYALSSGTGTAYDAANAAKVLGLEGAKISEDLAQRSILTRQDTVKFSVVSAVEKIHQALSAESYLEAALEVKIQDVKVSDIKRAQGMVSDTQNRKDRLELDSLRQKAVAQKVAVQIAYDTLNKLIDLPAGSMYSVDKSILAYKPLGQVNLGAEITRVLESSPDLYALSKSVEIAKLDKVYYVPNSGSENYAVKDLNISKATSDLESAKQATVKAVNDVYNGIVQLEAARAALESDLQSAIKTRDLTAQYYAAGLATALDLKKAQLLVSDLENQLLANVVAYNTLKRTFDKPWITVSN